MAAVGETALRREREDVGERLFEAVRGQPEVQLADAGVVDDDPAARQHDELPTRRRVATGSVLGERPRVEELLADERVDERGLADSGGTEEGRRHAWCEQSANPVDTEAGAHGDADHGHLAGDGGDLSLAARGVRFDVGFREEDRRPRSALPRERQIALEEARVQLVGERCGYEDQVDVRRDDLLARDVGTGIVSRSP